MSVLIRIHDKNPQQRLIQQSVAVLSAGGVIVYPTNSGYALGCRLEEKAAIERICRIRQLDRRYKFTLMCCNLAEIATYAHVDNNAFRLIKNSTPGNYTFVLRATNEVPRRLLNEKRRVIGLRLPSNPINAALLNTLAAPLILTKLLLPGCDFVETSAEEIKIKLDKQVDLIIDGGLLAQNETTVVDLTELLPTIIRIGSGAVAPFH